MAETACLYGAFGIWNEAGENLYWTKRSAEQWRLKLGEIVKAYQKKYSSSFRIKPGRT